MTLYSRGKQKLRIGRERLNFISFLQHGKFTNSSVSPGTYAMQWKLLQFGYNT